MARSGVAVPSGVSCHSQAVSVTDQARLRVGQSGDQSFLLGPLQTSGGLSRDRNVVGEITPIGVWQRSGGGFSAAFGVIDQCWQLVESLRGGFRPGLEGGLGDVVLVGSFGEIFDGGSVEKAWPLSIRLAIRSASESDSRSGPGFHAVWSRRSPQGSSSGAMVPPALPKQDIGQRKMRNDTARARRVKAGPGRDAPRGGIEVLRQSLRNSSACATNASWYWKMPPWPASG